MKGFGGNWGEAPSGPYDKFFKVPFTKNEFAKVSAYLHFLSHKTDNMDNSVSTFSKNTVLTEELGPFEKERFDAELSQLINKLVQIRESIQKQTAPVERFGGAPQKNTLTITLTYHE